MNISAINGSTQLSFGNKYQDKKTHPVAGALVGAAAGAAIGKFTPTVKVDVMNEDSFTTAAKTMEDKVKAEDKKIINKVKNIYAEKNAKIDKSLESIGFDKTTQELPFDEFLKKNMSEQAITDWLKQYGDKVGKECTLSEVPVDEKVNWLKSDVEYLRGILAGYEDGTNKNLEGCATIEEAKAKMTKLYESKTIAYDLTQNTDLSSGKISRKSCADFIASSISKEVKDAVAIYREQVNGMAKSINMKKVKVLGVLGLGLGAVAGSLLKTNSK